MDRNARSCARFSRCLKSLSARRAWIEITLTVRNVPIDSVALRKESVDRNFDIRHTASTRPRSLSARRAWIEMRKITITVDEGTVALRKESVDRNVNLRVLDGSTSSSLSARRAWIEIHNGAISNVWAFPVALRKESVDRNMPKIGTLRSTHSRSPQGERG